MEKKGYNLGEITIKDITIKKDGYYINGEKISEEEFDNAFSKAEEEHFDKVHGLDVIPEEEDLEENMEIEK